MINYKQDQDTKSQISFIAEQDYGCKYCYDDYKKQDKELYFFDHANNLRFCLYCPYCGRKIGENKNV